jgi:protein-S-isoprenylcysteine O-methyltransferase Ste14
MEDASSVPMKIKVDVCIQEARMSKMRKSFTEDWTLLPLLVFLVTGFAVAILDFVFLQNLTFQVYALAGLCLLLIGGYLRFKARFELKKKAGFSSLASTARLQIVENHRLVTDGLYRHVRHPIYLAETLRNFGFVLILSSIYGTLFIAAGTILLLLRIRGEEKMLIEAFGEDYKEYQRSTKRIIPYIY